MGDFLKTGFEKYKTLTHLNKCQGLVCDIEVRSRLIKNAHRFILCAIGGGLECSIERNQTRHTVEVVRLSVS